MRILLATKTAEPDKRPQTYNNWVKAIIAERQKVIRTLANKYGFLIQA